MSSGGGSGEDALAGLFFIIVVAAVVIFIILALVAAYLSVLIGKLINLGIRALGGWIISDQSSESSVELATLTVLFGFPLFAFICLATIAFSSQDTFTRIVVIVYSLLAVVGYYAGHFGTSPDSISFLQIPGVMRIHAQETKWLNQGRTEWLIFWHWKVARQAVQVDQWFRDSIGSLTGLLKNGG